MATQAGLLDSLSEKLLRVHGGCQIFIFGPDGSPFWAARTPEQHEIDRLSIALDLIEKLESSKPRPFAASDPKSGLVVDALDERNDLYFVIIRHDSEAAAMPPPAEAVRKTLLPHVSWLRDELAELSA